MASVTRTAVKSLQGGVGYELAGAEAWAPEAVAVSWDGTAAAGSFVVAVSFYNDGGALIDRAFPEGVTNAPGDTGRTFFRPFKRAAAASSGAGIKFDTRPQAGGWLEISTTSEPSVGASGMHFDSSNGYNLDGGTGNFTLSVGGLIQMLAAGGIATLEGTDVLIKADSATLRLQCTPGTVRADADIVQLNPSTRIELNGPVFVNTLPIVNPGGSGQLWNDAGTVKVT